MKRRQLLKTLAYSGVAAASARAPRLYAAPATYDGNLLICLQAEGGWDPTSLCDPKMNTGDWTINHWADSAETQVAGNVPYAPFANNTALFEKYHQYMLVVNGIDAQTNAHSTGVLHNWSGRNAAGFPTLTAMFSAHNAPDVPLSYINYGGFSDTGRLIRFSRLDDVNALLALLSPRINVWNPDESLRRQSEIDRLTVYQQARLARRLARTDLTPRQRDSAQAYFDARSSRESLSEFAAILPASDQFSSDVELGTRLGSSSLMRQVELTVLAMRAGVASAADLFMSGFDTHTEHDADHQSLFAHLADAIDYLWTYAEENGVADRLTVVIGSDFGRTNHYNDSNGKDHWPISSMIVMGKDVPWGDRVVGSTDEVHNAHRINPDTLQRDDTGGTIIYPKHVHKALRRHLGLEFTSVDTDFQFTGTEDFDLFNPDKRTG